jgi:hypothetical protein
MSYAQMQRLKQKLAGKRKNEADQERPLNRADAEAYIKAKVLEIKGIAIYDGMPLEYAYTAIAETLRELDERAKKEKS